VWRSAGTPWGGGMPGGALQSLLPALPVLMGHVDAGTRAEALLLLVQCFLAILPQGSVKGYLPCPDP